ncbi:MAG: YiiX/YebB-like N1pC/P60 family cysteine hydrolase, partial [Bdellovibrionota bacterium]
NVNDNKVLYRNVVFQPGDIILANRKDDSDGIFTTLVEGHQCFAHVAIFAMLEKEGMKYPSIVEIHHEGVRAIPLKVYLSDNFISYVEVYRHKSSNTDFQNCISRESQLMLNEVHGFSIYMDDSQEVYLSCALTASQLYRRAGMGPVTGKSRYSLKTIPNLRVLGNECGAFRDLLMPDDFAKNTNFKIVGAIDNGRFYEVTARTLARERIRIIWQTRTLNPKKFPKIIPIVKFCINRIHNRTWVLGPWLAKKMGFTVENFPSGPATFISMVPTTEARMMESSRILAAVLKASPMRYLSCQSWDEFNSQPELRKMVVKSLAHFEELYR